MNKIKIRFTDYAVGLILIAFAKTDLQYFVLNLNAKGGIYFVKINVDILFILIFLHYNII